MGRFVDLTGQRFGKLVVIERVYNGRKDAHWRCKCDCGKEVITSTGHLKDGHTKSCGCYSRSLLKETATKHGQYKTRLYNVWWSIYTRCYVKSSNRYKQYGDKGIIMCDEWKNDFMTFYNWSMENGYKEDIDKNGRNQISIDRIDNNGNYETNNCRWVDRKTQANNKSINVKFLIAGESLTAKQVAEKYNINYRTFMSRLYRGFTFEEAIQGKRLR